MPDHRELESPTKVPRHRDPRETPRQCARACVRGFAFVLAASLAVALLAHGCSCGHIPINASTQVDPSNDDVTPAAIQTLELPAIEHEGVTGGAAVSQRVALLIVAGEYPDASWNLASRTGVRDTLKKALTQSLAIPDGAVTVLQGTDVTAGRVRRTLNTLLGRLGPEGLALVYYYGHGFVRQDQMLELFTADTERRDSAFTETISYPDLGSWLAPAKQRGARTVLVIDACRPKTLAPPGPAEIVPVADATLFSASNGQFAAESVFAEAFAESLKEAARDGTVTLDEVFSGARTRVQTATNNAQKPWTPKDSGHLLLRSTGGFTLRVRAVNAFDRTQALEGASVRLNGREQSSPAQFANLRPGTAALEVRHEGSFWRSTEIELAEADAGTTLVVPLLPAFVFVTGVLENPEPSSITVALANERPDGYVQGYHVTRAVVSGRGAFRLKIPAGLNATTLVVKRAGTVLHRLPLTRALETIEVQPTRLSGKPGPKLRVRQFDCGTLAIDPGGTAADYGSALVVGDLVFPNDFKFTDSVGVNFYDRARKQAERRTLNQLDQLLRTLEALLTDNLAADARTKDGLTQLRAQARLARILEQAKTDADGAREALLAAVKAESFKGDLALQARTQAVRWLGTAATNAADAGNFADATSFLKTARALTPDDDAKTLVDRQARRAWRAWLRAAIDQALADDTWPAAKQVLADAREVLGNEDAELQALAATLTRENMPRAARERVVKAHAAYAAGELEAAWSLYQAARPDCNAHYAAQVDAQIADLAARLFIRYFNEADDRVAVGDRQRALQAYLHAARYRPRSIAPFLEAFARSDPELAEAWKEGVKALGGLAPYRQGHPLSGAVYIPSGAKVVIDPGSTLYFAPEAGIECYGELIVRGTENAPVRFTAIDATRGWNNLTLRGSQAKATLRWAIVENGRGAGDSEGDRVGGGIAVYAGATLIAEHLTIRKCKAKYGGGLFLLGNPGNPATSTCTDSRFEDNEAEGEGGGANINASANAGFENCVFSGNKSESSGGAINVICGDDAVSALVATGCTFENNQSGSSGGGVNANVNSTARFENCRFINNRAVSNGGGLLALGVASQPTKVTVNDSQFRENTAGHSGGGANINRHSVARFARCQFADNVAVEWGGGLLAIGTDEDPLTELFLDTCDFRGNRAKEGQGPDLRVSARVTFDTTELAGSNLTDATRYSLASND